jgi:hypothetical protein
MIEYVLIFTDNYIGGEGATALSECLKSNSSLQELCLFGRSNQKFYTNMFLQLQKMKLDIKAQQHYQNVSN